MAHPRTFTMLLALSALLVGAATASAQAPSLADFDLKPSASLQPRVDALDAQLRKSGVQQLLAEANRPATFGEACATPAFAGMTPPAQRYCFDPQDTGPVGGDDRVEWVPQGVTTVADAQQDELWGASQALLVSWYDKRTEPKKGVRITFLEPNTKKYRHVLLVYPYTNSKGNPSYEIVGRPQGGIHAGGILWYGNYLYVADTTRGVRVFDMRSIFDLAKSPNGDAKDQKRIGRQDGVYYGFGYRYVMPQVGAWVNAAGPDNDGTFACKGSGAPKFSYVSIDRSAVPDRLVTGEYCSSKDPGRVARWPLDGATGQLMPDPRDGHVHATDVYRLPDHNVQGAVSNGATWYLSRSHGGSAGQLLLATPDASPQGSLHLTDSRPAGIGPEDLSFWPSHNEVWTVTEHAGRRVLYGAPG